MTTLATNPRFANCARAHGREPSAQLEQDRNDWPGGMMIGFIHWNRARIREFAIDHPHGVWWGGLVEHALYDSWLTAWVDRTVAAAAATSRRS